MDSGMTYQKLQESTSLDLIVTDLGGRFRQGLTLCAKACDNNMVDVQLFFLVFELGLVVSMMVVEVKKKKYNRLRDLIVPYIAKNLQPYITQPPIRSHGDWGQSQFQLGGDDESTHQLPSNGLLFSTLYHFPYTADPPISTMLMQPSPTIVRSFTRSPPTIPIAPLVQYHIEDLPYDLQTMLLYFSFLSLLSFTRCILSQPD